MTGAAAMAARCAHCAGAADIRADDGLWSCSPEHLLLARILGERAATVRPVHGRADPGSMGRTRAVQVEWVTATRAARRRQKAVRDLRTLCEDTDELLARAAEAARVGAAGAAVSPLAEARHAVVTILRALHQRPVPAACTAASCAEVLDEDRVLATLALLEELDSQLGDACAGYRGAGWRAVRLAGQLLSAVDELIIAAASGRTRARAVAPVIEGGTASQPGDGPP